MGCMNNTPTQTPVNAVSGPQEPPLSNATPVESDSTPFREVTAQIAEDVRPLIARLSVLPDAARPLLERARPWADPLVDEMRPLINDLRPAVEDLRVRLSDALVRVTARATQLVARLGPDPVGSLGRIVDAKAQRLASMRPTSGAASSAHVVEAPRIATGPRLPSIPLGAALRSTARRLRPGRWAFRTVAVGTIALVLSNATLRDAMVAEISWSRSVLETIEMPTVELPTIDMPTIEMPAIQMPAFEIPSFQLPTGESAAATKLAPASFELPPLGAYRAAFETQASYPTVPANATVEWVVALRNTGSVGWYRGIAGAQAALALTDGTQVAVQSTEYVAPGQVGWFIARFKAPAGPGTHSVALFPRIDGRGELPDLGILAFVTVR
jgi:hypothetical protein